MTVYVLFRYRRKTGIIDTCMTGITSAMMRIWALQNTTAGKNTIVCERDTGRVIFKAEGGKDLPKVERGDVGTCEDFGISLETLQSIKDERYD